MQIHNSNNCNSKSMRNLILAFLGGLTTVPALADVVGVEAEVHATSEYGTTYRVYVNFDAPDDELIAVYGTVGEVQNAPLSILTTSSFFNSELAQTLGKTLTLHFLRYFQKSSMTVG